VKTKIDIERSYCDVYSRCGDFCTLHVESFWWV